MGSSTAHWLARKTNGQLKVGAKDAENNGRLCPLQDLKFHVCTMLLEVFRKSQDSSYVLSWELSN